MLTPGAQKSVTALELVKPAGTSALSVALMVSAFDRQPGKLTCVFDPSLPAAMTVATPAAARLFTRAAVAGSDASHAAADKPPPMLRLTATMFGLVLFFRLSTCCSALSIDEKNAVQRALVGLSWATLMATMPAPRATPS